MVKVESVAKNVEKKEIPSEWLENKRNLTNEEIAILEQNENHNTCWENFYVEKGDGNFNPKLIRRCKFSGIIIIGKLCKNRLVFNDLTLDCGFYDSRLNDVCCGDDCAVYNVSYFDNYKICDRVILFNIQELCCTKHSKFGNGILKNGETEDKRVWISVANENEGRKILPFEQMIPSDAYLWSHYRDDEELLKRFEELTEYGNTKELNTYGLIESDCVIKNSNIIKDSKIGNCTYIKGAFKLKNITILSSEKEKSQVGEGVEMVNGILGYGSRIFYQAIAVRFVIGRNCQVKYGARILNTVLGDNSTVSCCELLNNLIFPFHEQHHNSSFLIATTIMGQSNIAAGATIGSNHNSRSPDGEIFAKRGFWPGLCSDFKHNSRFASFCLISKGSYQYEMDIPYPFALVSPGVKNNAAIQIMPAWWFMYDMFAMARNSTKFLKRDKRVVKVQKIETDPMAPDTMQEIETAIERLIRLTAEHLKTDNLQLAKDYLHQNSDADFTLYDGQCQKKYGAIINKPVKAYKMYRKIVKYFSTKTLMEFCRQNNCETLTLDLINVIRQLPLYTEWENVGGQVMPVQKIHEIFDEVKSGTIKNWNELHYCYELCDAEYSKWKVRYALYLLEKLYSRPVEKFSCDLYRNITEDVIVVAEDMYRAAMESREKDYKDYYRTMVYRNEKEMENVIGPFAENEFLKEFGDATQKFVSDVGKIFSGLTK